MTQSPQAQRSPTDSSPPPSQEPATAPPSSASGSTEAGESTVWVGWVAFAAMMLILVGSFQVIIGLTALFQSDYYLVSSRNLLVNVDYNAWGWTHIILGALALGAALGLLRGLMWARILGIVMAMLSAIANLAFIAAYPLWAMTVMAIDVLVIYGIAMHGHEIERPT